MAAWRYIISLLVLKKYFTHSLCSLVKHFSTLKEKFGISERQCTILYVYIFFSYINITLSLNKAHRKSRTILQGNWKLWIKREGQKKIWLWAGSIYTFLQILSNTGMDRKGNIVFFFFQDGIKHWILQSQTTKCVRL